MNKHTKVTECPKCGSKELGEGKQSGYSTMQPVFGLLGSTILYTICTECGFIIEGFVTKPNRFRTR